jgi:y4mF family transcriptional regulator
MMKIYTVSDIGSLARKKRMELGLTQSGLADISGSGTRFISDFENGKPTLQIEKVLNALHVLGLDIFISERGSGNGT